MKCGTNALSKRKAELEADIQHGESLLRSLRYYVKQTNKGLTAARHELVLVELAAAGKLPAGVSLSLKRNTEQPK